MKKFLVFLVIILIVVVLITGCGEKKTTTTPPVSSPAGTTATTPATTAKPSDTPVSGGRLRFITGSNISNMGYPDDLSNPGDAGVSFTALEGLLTVDAKGNLLPWLAESWKVADDGKSVTFKLRQGVTFHDGSPFNAESAVFNMNMRINSKVWPNFKSVKSAEVIDPYTMKMNFATGFDWTVMFSLATFWSGREFSMQALKTQTPEFLRMNPIGTGPFKIGAYSRDQFIKFERFDNYWKGKPYVDGIDYKIIPDPTTSLLAFKSGEVDMLGVQPKDAADIKKSGAVVYESTDNAWNIALCPDSNNPNSPFAKVDVRRALEHAIDKKSMAEALGYGYWYASYQPFLPGMAVYNDQVVGYQYNPAKAKELLTKAGYPNGFKTDIMMVDFMVTDWVVVIQNQLKQVGIDLNFVKLGLPQLNEKVGVGWDGLAVSAVIVGPTTDPGNSLANGPLNNNTTWRACNQPEPALALARQAAAELNQEKRNQMYRDLSKMLVDEHAQWTYVYYGTNILAVSPKIKNHTIGQGAMYPWAFAWIAK